jgi:hypothetical protein
MKVFNNSLSILSPIFFISAIFFAFHFLIFGDLLIFTEAREYIKYAGWPHSFWDYFVPSGKNTRYMSMFSFGLMKHYCGYNHVCINAYQLFVLSLAGIFLYIHSYQLFKNIATASFICLLWLFSLSTLDAISWQAVNHDKTAALFIFLTLTISTFLVEKPGYVIIFLSNVLITILLILAYNSKESAFFLMPLILLQYIFYATSRKALLENLVKITIPFGFSLYFITGYFVKMPIFWKEHTLSNGDVIHAIEFYANVLFNHDAYSLVWAMVLAMVVFTPLVLISLNYLLKKETRWLNLPLIYSYSFFILSISITVRTQFPSTYYMLVPLAGFLMTIMSSINIILYYLTNRVYLRRLFIVVLGGFTAVHLYNYSKFFDDSKYTRLSQHAHNMYQTFRTIANEVELSKAKTYYFIFPPNEHYFYILRGGTGGVDNTLINFIYKVDGDYRVDYIEYHDLKEINQLVREKSAYYFILDAQYHLLKILSN